MHMGKFNGELLSAGQSDLELVIEALESEKRLHRALGDYQENLERLEKLIRGFTAVKNALSKGRTTKVFRANGNMVRVRA